MRQKNLTRQELSYRLSLTPYGFDQMIKNQSMKVDTLEKMSKIFDVPITYWFDEYGIEAQELIMNEPSEQINDRSYFQSLQNQLERKDEQLKKKDEQLDALLEVLKGRNNE